MDGHGSHRVIDFVAIEPPFHRQRHGRPREPHHQGDRGCNHIAAGRHGHHARQGTVDQAFHIWPVAIIPTQGPATQHSRHAPNHRMHQHRRDMFIEG